jgi:hypothetical protein
VPTFPSTVKFRCLKPTCTQVSCGLHWLQRMSTARNLRKHSFQRRGLNGQLAWLTVDMLKSGTRIGGMIVRLK